MIPSNDILIAAGRVPGGKRQFQSAVIQVVEVVLLCAVRVGFDIGRSRATGFWTLRHHCYGCRVTICLALPIVARIDAVDHLLSGVVSPCCRAHARDVSVTPVT